MNPIDIEIPQLKPKTPFEQDIERLSLSDCLTLIRILSARAAYLNDTTPKPKKTILHAGRM